MSFGLFFGSNNSLGGIFATYPCTSTPFPPSSTSAHTRRVLQLIRCCFLPHGWTPMSPTTSIHTQQVITTCWVAISSPTTSKHPRRVVLTCWVAFLAPPPRPSHIMQHPTSPTTRWVFLRPSCILQPPTSRFDSLGGLFLLSWYLHPLSSSLHPPTSSRPRFATPNESLDSLGGFPSSPLPTYIRSKAVHIFISKILNENLFYFIFMFDQVIT